MCLIKPLVVVAWVGLLCPQVDGVSASNYCDGHAFQAGHGSAEAYAKKGRGKGWSGRLLMSKSYKLFNA